MSKRRAQLLGIAVGIVLVAVFAIYRLSGDTTSYVRSLVDTAYLEMMPQKDQSNIDTSHLADGLTPPTNKWFSGLALQSEPKASFATPLSFLPKNGSFEIGLPTVTTTDRTIFGLHSPGINVSIVDAAHYKVTRYDEMSLDLTYADKSGAKLGAVTLSAGSPYVFYEASKQNTLQIPATNVQVAGNTASYAKDSQTYYVVASAGANIATASDGITVNIPEKGIVTYYALPTGAKDTLREFAENKLSGATVSYGKKDAKSETTIHFETKNDKPTAYAYLPHQTNTASSIATYATLYGSTPVSSGKDFTFTTPNVPVTDTLDLSKLSQADQELLTTTLRREINATQFTANDTYFSGKSLYRAAQLLELAKQLNEPVIAQSIQAKLNQELDTWLSPGNAREEKQFYYDTKIHGVVGDKVSFGSEAFNDHHFHYGYFIYAASILAKYDPTFLTEHQVAVDALVADIANYKNDEKLPVRRSFDPYVGHSWASGSSPFSDGNNQESTSEAINAWVATSLWGDVTHNTSLQDESTWMLSNETASAKAYWLEYDQTTAPYNGAYTKSIVSLNWGGKRDYATFFSVEPTAALGIQLLPLNPTFTTYASNPRRIETNINEATGGAVFSGQFADYLLMYRSLYAGAGVLPQAMLLPDTVIDGANSRSYMYAWIMTR